jgi:hypothetical protein
MRRASMSERTSSPYTLEINGKRFDLEEEVYDLLLVTSKERDTLRENYASLESDYGVVNERALVTAKKLAKLDREFALEFESDEFWKIVATHAREMNLARHQKHSLWS